MLSAACELSAGGLADPDKPFTLLSIVPTGFEPSAERQCGLRLFFFSDFPLREEELVRKCTESLKRWSIQSLPSQN